MLKNELINLEIRYSKLHENVKKQLSKIPKGHLEINRKNNNVQYYYFFNAKKSYLPKSDTKVKSLASKSYLKKLDKVLSRRIKQLNNINKEFENDEIENIYNSSKSRFIL